VGVGELREAPRGGCECGLGGTWVLKFI
jgi:hypothetical protein